MIKIIKEVKEDLPIGFITSFIGRGWDQVGSLKTDIKQIEECFKNTKKVTKPLQDLIDAYLICISELERQLDDKYIDIPEISESNSLKESTEIKIELPEDTIISVEDVSSPAVEIIDLKNSDAIEEPACEEIVVSEIEKYSENNDPIKGPVESSNQMPDPYEGAEFQYFVDFDEPDLTEPKLTDEDIEDMI